MTAPAVVAARQKLIGAAVAVLDRWYDDGDSPQAVEAAYDAMALAGRELTNAIDGLPAEAQPAGWAS